jgi:hypothetical protein
VLLRANRNSNSLDSDCLLWVNSVVANGGSVSVFRSIIVSNFIKAEKASGAWFITDDYWSFWAENEIQALTSIKQRRLATVVNSPTFTSDRGYATDGATNYIDLGFISNIHSLNMTLSSLNLEIYERSNVSSNNYSIAVNSGTNRSLTIRTRVTGSLFLQCMNSVSTHTLAVLDSRGLTSGSRYGTLLADTLASKNGVNLTKTVDPTSLGASLPSHSIYVGCYNSMGTATGFKASSFGYASCGGFLSAAQRLARYQNVQRWATAVGAQV